MGDGFQVVLDDLSSMATTFAREAGIYAQIKPRITPPVADAGDDTLNHIIKVVMECLDVLHTKMTEGIDEHATLLRKAHDSYQRHDLDNRALFDDLMPE